jgi:hypothetical protein
MPAFIHIGTLLLAQTNGFQPFLDPHLCST